MELGPTEAVNLIASGEFEYLDVRCFFLKPSHDHL